MTELTSDNRFTIMQRTLYQTEAAQWDSGQNRNKVVGNWDLENENNLYDFAFDGFIDKNLLALEFGCGPGRNLVRYNKRFNRIDGADISGINLDKAKLWLSENNISHDDIQLYETDGISLSGVPSNTYDLVFSFVCMQHISVYPIRYNILTDMKRVLKEGGWITIQMGFGPDRQGGVDYYNNNFEISGTNGMHDVLVTSSQQLQKDLDSMGYKNFSYTVTECAKSDLHNNWIFFRAQA